MAATVTERESCDWEIAADYRDAAGTRGELRIRDDDGKPFRAEAPPVAPDQYFLLQVRPYRLVPATNRSTRTTTSAGSSSEGDWG